MLTTRSLAAVAVLVIAALAAIVLGSVNSHPVSSHGDAVGSSSAASAVVGSVVGVGPAVNAVTLAFDQRDVRYSMCSGSARPPLALGEFTKASVTGGCLSGVSVAAPPVCTPSVEVGSYLSGLWVGVNPVAHSVLYQTSGVSRVTLAARWCAPPAARTTDGTAVSLGQIPKGATVRMVTSVDGWVTGVIVQRPSDPAG